GGAPRAGRRVPPVGAGLRPGRPYLRRRGAQLPLRLPLRLRLPGGQRRPAPARQPDPAPARLGTGRGAAGAAGGQARPRVDPPARRTAAPADLWFPLPLEAGAVAAAIAKAARGGEAGALAPLIGYYGTAILHEAALSRERADFWIERFPDLPALRHLRFDLLLA